MSDLLKKLKKSSVIKSADKLSDSEIFNKEVCFSTPIPILNAALSGNLKGGFKPGLLILAGPSKHFKSLMGLIMAKSYLDRHEDAVLVFYDNEFGTPSEYFKNAGIDPERVLHKPINNIEELKHDIASLLENDIQRGDKVFILVDSVGNLASKKEVEDALDQKSVADMTRAKMMKSVFRIVTPYLTTKDIPMCVIGHTYSEMSLFPRQIVSGGTGQYYSASDIWIIGRKQEKNTTGILGYEFVINSEKSRTLKEKAKLSFRVLHNEGIDYYSGLLDIATNAKLLAKVKPGKYQLINEDGEPYGEEVREKAIGKLLDTILEDEEKFNILNKKCVEMYSLNHGSLFGKEQELEEEIEELENGE